MRKKIVFIPTYYYLSNSLFFNIIEKISDYEKVYFNTKDPASRKYNKKGIKKEEILKYFDIYCEVDKGIGYKDNKNNRLQYLFKFKNYVKKIQEILDDIKPVIIITTASMSYSARASNQWANKNNIPVIIIQPCFLDFENKTYSLRQQIKYLLFNKVLNIPLCRRQTYFGNEDKNNYLFLWSEYFKQYYKDRSIYNNIYITGNPVFDKYFTTYKKENDSYCKMLNIPSNKNIVVFCTQNIGSVLNEDNFAKIIELLKKTIIDNKECFFVIKVHPSEEIKKYNIVFKEIRQGNYKIIKDINLHALYKIADVQISFSSYSSFEAVVLGVPIILIDPDNKYKFIDDFDNEIELRASTSEELNNQLKKCLKEEYKNEFKFKRKKYLKSRLTYLDGKCGERVANKIEEIIQKHI